ncbi:MAG: hypothetical protein WD071_11840 [Pseudohongiella sp.]|uniref:hypothetical protein n=1 Tax=Pseudohongiella sp. TaxID=1979412 RepID=UPI0034A09AD4
MMRILYISALTALLASCQGLNLSPGSRDEVTRVIDYHQSLQEQNDTDLLVEADQLREELMRNPDDAAVTRLQLLLLETQLQARELRRTLEAQSQQIQALNTQIEALTAIEQQINRRGQLQEIDND